MPSFQRALDVTQDLYVIDYSVHDLRFPTSLAGDGTDAMNTSCDYSAAYVKLYVGPKGSVRTSRSESGTPPRPTSLDVGGGRSELRGHGMTFTIGRGNELCCQAIDVLCSTLLLGQSVPNLLADMGATWRLLVSDSQLRWVGPEKGVIHLATGAVVNALWDLFARAEGKPLWRLITDMTSQEVVSLIPFRYITDALTPQEALAILGQKQSSKQARQEEVATIGYPAYTTSAGWSGYDDAKVARLTREALAAGFTHFKLKVGSSLEDDKRRMTLVRNIIDNPSEMPANFQRPSQEAVEGKKAGPTGCVLMIDSNQVFDVPQAIEYVSQLAEYRPWFIEEPTAPDDILGHATIRKGLAESGIAVATGEHAHSRLVFKQLLQAEAIDVVQIDSCRLAGVNEVLAVLLLAKKFNKIVCPHAGGVGLCEMVIHLSLIDYCSVTGNMQKNVLEWVDHLHEHFKQPVSVDAKGRYIAPEDPGYSIEFKDESVEDYAFPNGAYWTTGQARIPPPDC